MSKQNQYTEYYSDESDEYEEEMYQINEQHRRRALQQKQNQSYHGNDDTMDENGGNRYEEQQLGESTASTAPTMKPLFQSKLLKMKSNNTFFGSSKWNKRYFTVEATTVDEYGNIHASDCAVCYYNSKHDVGLEPTGWFYVHVITDVRKSSYWKGTLKPFENSKKYIHGFQVTTPTRTYQFRARNESDLDMWIYGLSSIAGLDANHVSKWPMKTAGDPPERIVHGAGHGMRAAREKHMKRLQARDTGNDDVSDNDDNSDEDDIKYEQRTKTSKKHVFRGRHDDDNDEQAQEELEDIEKRNIMNKRNARKQGREAARGSENRQYQTDTDDDEENIVNIKKKRNNTRNQEREETDGEEEGDSDQFSRMKRNHTKTKKLWGRRSKPLMNNFDSSDDEERAYALKDDIRNWTVSGKQKKHTDTTDGDEDSDDRSFLKKSTMKKQSKSTQRDDNIQTIHSLDHGDDSDNEQGYATRKAKRKVKESQASSSNGLTTTKAFLGLDELSDDSEFEEEEEQKPPRPMRLDKTSRNGKDTNNIQKSIESAIVGNLSKDLLSDSEEEEEEEANDLSESTNRLLNSLIRKQTKGSSDEDEPIEEQKRQDKQHRLEENQTSSSKRGDDDFGAVERTPKKKSKSSKSTSKKKKRKPRPPPGLSDSDDFAQKVNDDNKPRKTKKKSKKGKKKSKPKPPDSPLEGKTTEMGAGGRRKNTGGNTSRKKKKKEDVDNLFLSDEDDDVQRRDDKKQQNNKAGVVVDDNFAEEAWDESSMEVSKGD